MLQEEEFICEKARHESERGFFWEVKDGSGWEEENIKA